MEFQVLAVGRKGRALKAGGFACLDPEPARLGDGLARAVRGVDASADFDVSGGGIIICHLLFRERLQPSLTGLIDVVDDPGLFLNALCSFPSAFAD